MQTQAKEVSEVLKVIANANRLMILCVLEETSHTVSEISEQISDISLPALSQHLSALKLAGILKSEKKGMHVIYEIQDYRVLEVMKKIKEVYCKDAIFL